MNSCRARQVVAQIALAMSLGLPAAEGGAGLKYNPFDKPDVLNEPVVRSSPQPVQETTPPALKGTLVSADSPMVVLEDALLRLGEVHGGYRLVSVEEGAAVFEHDGKQIRVLIDKVDSRVK